MTVEEIRGSVVCNNKVDKFPIGMRVLVVDDDPTCLKLMDGLLRKCQYHVTTTNGAITALKMLRENKNRFDLIITDDCMPDMDGFKLLELVGLEMDLPVIMFSANSDPKLVMKGITHGACDYLVKPVRLSELRNIWQHVIRRKVETKSQSMSNNNERSNQGINEGGDQIVRMNRKSKDEDDDDDDDENGDDSDDPSSTQNRPRVVWSNIIDKLQISLQEILLATNHFSEENSLGLGGFGKVYKGDSEKHGIIAVKRLDRKYGQGDPEFKREIDLLSEYKHENVVSLVGFCDEAGEKILVYKFESNGSLDEHLRSKDLKWIQRLGICLDAARGLQYLHDDAGDEHRILHRDVKSANILLDNNWNAKISDFGLSRLGPAQSSFVMTNACGTPGYIDPDYFYTGHLTQKSDVFSFGVVLFEVLCGRPACVQDNKQDGRFFYILAQKHHQMQTLDKIIDPDLLKQINKDSLLIYSTIAYQCLKIGVERPTMNNVVEQLEKALKEQQEPGSSYSEAAHDDHPLPAVESLQISGEAFPG